MLLLRLWNYIRGYVIIEVEGYFLEKFINICINKQIFLWDIKRRKNSKMYLRVSIRAFKSLPPIARKTGCRIRIIKKCGLPFKIHKFKARKMFVIGAAVFIFLIYLMSSFVWTIEVKGNDRISTQTIVDKLASIGIKPGVLKFGINLDAAANKMMLQEEDLSWIGVSIKGTKVKVQVFERVKAPKLVPDEKPCDIIASKDGVIKSISTKIGQQAVNNDDTVTKGQLLISGTVESKNKDVKPKVVHAMGTVKARTWYEAESPVNFVLSEKVRTGKVKNKYSVVLFSKKFNLFFKKAGGKNYERVEVRHKLSIGKDLVFPFELISDKYYEEKTINKELDIDEAKKIAVDNAYSKAKKNIPDNAEIEKRTVSFVENDDGELTAKVIVECIENIGVAREIGGN
ncbi:MAG TPA: sporulation protein YqfD [Clostridia bacterium]|nr:sporulation protein YqfD [Clostridia bacterium]